MEQGSFLLLGLIVLVQLSLGADIALKGKYASRAAFTPEFSMLWSTDKTDIHFAFVVQHQKGWFGVGLGEPAAGTMKGSDMALLTNDGTKVTITDSYALRFAPPKADKIADWKLDAHSSNSTHFAYEVSRPLDTGDHQDRPINGVPAKMMFAMGKTPKVMYHGTKRWVHQVALVPDTEPHYKPTETDLKSFTFGFDNFAVPDDDGSGTAFGCVVGKVPKMDSPAHMVQFTPVLGDDIAHIHHIVLLSCMKGPNTDKYYEEYKDGKICGDGGGTCQPVWVWAQGRPGGAVPEEAGFLIGGTKAYAATYMSMQVHYNYPGAKSFKDSTKVKIDYTHKLRKHDAGIMVIGDMTLGLPDMPPNQPYIPFEITCPSECTKNWNHDITVFSDFLHMHRVGSRIWTTVHRPDGTWDELHRIDFWDYGTPRHPNEHKVKLSPGDRLNLHCVYDTTPNKNVTTFGQTTHNEMCFDIITYYPVLMEGSAPWFVCGSFTNQKQGDDGRVIKTLCGNGSNRTSDFLYDIENNPPAPELRDPMGCHTQSFGISGEVKTPVCKYPLNTEGLPEQALVALDHLAPEPCTVYPCGKGKCVPSQSSRYRTYCQCPPGMSGLHCDAVDAMLCLTTNPCGANGKCVGKFGKELCECKPGFYGPNCTETKPPVTKCDSLGLSMCIMNARFATKCQQHDAYIKCAKQHKCENILNIWCGSMMNHNWECGTWRTCDAVAKTSCSSDVYRQCFMALTMSKKKMTKCEYYTQYMQCAQDSSCPDVAGFICQKKITGCDAITKACKTDVTLDLSEQSATIADWSALEESLDMPSAHHEPSGLGASAVIIVLGCVAVVAVVAIAVVVVRSKRRDSLGYAEFAE